MFNKEGYMNKKLLAISMCLALSTTVALAANMDTKCPQKNQNIAKSMPKAPEKVCKKGDFHQMTKEQRKSEFEKFRKQQRTDLYKELGLSSEQIAKANAIEAKYDVKRENSLKKLHKAGSKYRYLKDQQACEWKLKMQKKSVEKAKEEVRTQFKASRDEFEAILTPEQKTKLKNIEDKRKQEFKKHMKNKKMHKGKMLDARPNFEKMGPPPKDMMPPRDMMPPKAPCKK